MSERGQRLEGFLRLCFLDVFNQFLVSLLGWRHLSLTQADTAPRAGLSRLARVDGSSACCCLAASRQFQMAKEKVSAGTS